MKKFQKNGVKISHFKQSEVIGIAASFPPRGKIKLCLNAGAGLASNINAKKAWSRIKSGQARYNRLNFILYVL